jgi:DDE superfamily endonuclease
MGLKLQVKIKHSREELQKAVKCDCFQRFLELLPVELGNDVAVIQFDQGSFHTIKTLDCPENIIPIFQPPHSPELNPIERFWEFLKSKLHS